MGKKDKEKKVKHGFYYALTAGFDAIKVLDNTNIYAVLFSETTANIFISGMWMKILNPYTLVVSGGDKICVGNNITIAGLTRAVVGVFAGQFLIDKLGCDQAFAITGAFGVMGIVINIWCLMHTSLNSIYILNFVWAVFNGLWNSCLETEWARSIVKQKREDVNDARQVMNKMTGVCGPLISIGLFLYVGGTGWTIPVLTFVMICGTIGSVIPVLLCFNFSRDHEVRQECSLYEIREIEFSPDLRYSVAELCKEDFEKKPGGPIRVTYPLSGKSKFGKLRVLTPDLRETPYILGKSLQSTFKGKSNLPAGDEFRFRDLTDMDDKVVDFLNSHAVSHTVSEYASDKLETCPPEVQARVIAQGKLDDADASSDLVKRVKEYWKVPKLKTSDHGTVVFQPCLLHFVDPTRESVPAEIENIVIYLNQDRAVNPDASSMVFHLSPALEGPKAEATHKYWFWTRGIHKVFFKKKADIKAEEKNLEVIQASKSLSQSFRMAAPALPSLGEEDTVDVEKPLETPLLQVSPETPQVFPARIATIAPTIEKDALATNSSVLSTKAEEHEPPAINMVFANVIVFCDVMNAVGSGMSLKFMDLFLMTDYGVQPVTLLSIAIVQSLAVVWLTPMIKTAIRAFQRRGWNGALLVSVVWLLSALFLILIIIPNQNFWVVLVAIIMMNSLSSCTKAYNRAQLVNSLPHNRVANYMVWDSLNKANQGGIAVFGGQVAHLYGYRGCFAVTFVILILRWIVWTGYIFVRYRTEAKVKGGTDENLKKTLQTIKMNRKKTSQWDEYDDQEGCTPSEVTSELFSVQQSERRCSASHDDAQEVVNPLFAEVMETIMETEGADLLGDVDMRYRGTGSLSAPVIGRDDKDDEQYIRKTRTMG